MEGVAELETTNLATLVLFSHHDELAHWQGDEDLVELVFIPCDDNETGCNCWVYEFIG